MLTATVKGRWEVHPLGVLRHLAGAEPGSSCLQQAQNWGLGLRVQSQHLFPNRAQGICPSPKTH